MTFVDLKLSCFEWVFPSQWASLSCRVFRAMTERSDPEVSLENRSVVLYLVTLHTLNVQEFFSTVHLVLWK